MEGAQVEVVAQPRAGALAQALDLELADLVRARLPGPHDVALHLRHHLAAGLSGVREHVVDGLLARPASPVDAGVDDEARRAEDLVDLLAEAVPRRRMEPLLRGELLGVERPALDEGDEGNDPPEEGNARHLLRERDLEMVAGNRLVVRERAHREARDLAGIAQVGVEDARPRAIEGRALVVGARRAPLLECGHALHDDGGAGQPPEERRKSRLRVVKNGLEALEHLPSTFFGVGEEEALVAVESADRGERVVGRDPLRREDVTDLLAEARDLGEPQAVDVLGREVGRRVEAQGPAVVRVSVGQLPDARLVRRAREEPAERLRESAVGGLHHVRDRRAPLRQQRVPRARAEVRDPAEIALEVGVEGGLLDRPVADLLAVLDHGHEDEARRQDAAVRAEADALDELVERRTEGLETGDVAARVARVLDLVDVHHEVWQRRLPALELLDRIAVEPEAPAVLQRLEQPREDVGREPLFGRLGVPVVAAQSRQEPVDLVGEAIGRFDREILELVGVEVQAVGLEHPRVGEEHRVVERELDEHPQVVVLDRPGLAPDRRDEEDGGGGEDDRTGRGSESRPRAQSDPSGPGRAR